MFPIKGQITKRLLKIFKPGDVAWNPDRGSSGGKSKPHDGGPIGGGKNRRKK